MRELIEGRTISLTLRAGLGTVAVLLLTSFGPTPGLLGQIKILGEVRVITRLGPLSFYRDADGLPRGPEYDLARRFADELGVRLKLVPVSNYSDIYDALKSGRAHVAAAALKVPAAAIEGIEFGPRYQRVREHLVYLHGATRPGSLAEIGNGHLEVPAGGAHAMRLKAARNALPDLVWVENSDADSRKMLDAVADGTIDYTIADSTEFALAHDAHPDLRIAFDFPGAEPLAWAVSARNAGFLQDLDEYFARLYRDGELSTFVSRYYAHSENVELAATRGFMQHLRSRLPLYKQWFEEAAEQMRQDWRLLAAIGYQESKWDPGASSAAGAKGLMQLTVDTASEARVENPTDPRQSIFGGARYFRHVYAEIPARIPEPDKTWFALAAYNIGYGHLEDARVLTQKAGRDPDAWSDVREFLPLLAEEYWYTQTENGYARGWEPVRYVDNVRDYRDMLEWASGSTTALN